VARTVNAVSASDCSKLPYGDSAGVIGAPAALLRVLRGKGPKRSNTFELTRFIVCHAVALIAATVV
jgi:hypothetical protein